MTCDHKDFVKEMEPKYRHLVAPAYWRIFRNDKIQDMIDDVNIKLEEKRKCTKNFI